MVQDKPYSTDNRHASLRQLFDQLNAGIAQCSIDGIFSEVNDRYCEITGYSRDQLLNMGMAMITHPDDLVTNIPLLEKCRDHGENFVIRKRYVRPDNSIVWVKNSVSRVTDVHGRHIITAISIDVTDHVEDEERLALSEARYKQLSQELEQMVSQRTRDLERSNEQLQRFAHVICHDLKEPVRRQRILLDRLRDILNDAPPGVLTCLQKLETGAESMYRMIGAILEYSENRDQLPLAEQVNLQELVKDVLTKLELLIEDADAQVSYTDLPTVKGSGVLLHQLFYNLITNAIKFRKADTPLQVRITSYQRDSILYIVIEDNGIGFEPGDGEKIFTLYTRLHARSQYDGTGLGLALCRNIVTRHGGTITASGRVGNGATFTIQLPIEQ